MHDFADITVIIPNYNHAPYIPDCLNAMLSQSVLPREILMIDDASNDDSVLVIKEYQAKWPMIKLIENRVNQGPVKALNKAIHLAEGKYVAFCAADDHVLPGFFEEGGRLLDLYPMAGICCSDPSFFKDQRPYRFICKRIINENAPIVMCPEEVRNRMLFTAFWLPSHASLFRKEFVISSGGFPENLFHLSDWYLNLKVAFSHGVVYFPGSFGAFRICPQSYGASLNRNWIKKIKIYRDLFRILACEKTEFKELFCRSGALGNISADVLIYLLGRPALWMYIPTCFYRKFANFIRKFSRALSLSR